jgi:hypothetical protein
MFFGSFDMRESAGTFCACGQVMVEVGEWSRVIGDMHPIFLSNWYSNRPTGSASGHTCTYMYLGTFDAKKFSRLVCRDGDYLQIHHLS